MIDYVIASTVSATSGRALAAKISELQGGKCHYFGTDKPPKGKRHVRYGSHVATTGECLNKLDAVLTASNKLGALLIMDDAGVRIPRLYHWGNAPQGKVVFRKIRRCGGSDSPNIQPSYSELPPGYDYAMEWIEKFEEYRVHVFLGKVVRVQVKRRSREGVKDKHIWSESNGWVLVECESPFSWLDHLATKAVASLGLDFGAVDIVRSKWGGLYVIEVNTAPGLNERGVEIYARLCTKWDQQLPNMV